jgi:hypothetical protein
VFASYLALFAALAWPWLAAADRAIPIGGLVDRADARLLAFQLGWIAHAAIADPTYVLDAPIFHPAPRQITGSEALFSTQLAFAPVYWATGNSILAASLAAFLTYPLAALAMSRLAVGLGCGEAAAWVGGLVFALGPLRVPANLQVLQYPNLYLPLAALAVTRLRLRPTAGRVALLAAALAVGFLASFYLAVMLAIATAAWAAMELVRAAPGRIRFAALAGLATAAAALPLAAATLPYLGRLESSFADPLAALRTAAGIRASLHTAARALADVGLVPWALAAAGLGFVVVRGAPIGTAARRGAVLLAVAVVLMLGPAAAVGDVEIPLPFAWLAASPARFFRLPWRFVVVAGFGVALLAAAALEALARRGGGRLGAIACGTAAVALAASRGLSLPGTALDPVPAQGDSIYADLRAAAGPLRGPMLELPLATRDGPTAPDAMLGILRHRLPSVDGHTGYPPPHARFVRARAAELASGGELQDVVDMTHLAWILLRPAEQWPNPEQRARVLARDDLRLVLSEAGWDLLRVELEPRHPEWFAAVAGGSRPGETALGTPLAPLAAPAGALDARVEPERVAPGGWFVVRAEVRNGGAEPWPALLGPRDPKPLGVKLSMRLVPVDAEASASTAGDAALPAIDATSFLWRDVPAGDRLAMSVPLAAPARPGRYRLEVGLLQRAGAAFDVTRPAPAAPMLIVAAEAGDDPRAAERR